MASATRAIACFSLAFAAALLSSTLASRYTGRTLERSLLSQTSEALFGRALSSDNIRDCEGLRGNVDTAARYPATSSPRYEVLQEIEESYLLSTTEEAHKSLFPLTIRDIVGFALTIIVLFIAAGGGIGGGGAIIPIYLLFLGFETRIAVALGNITIVGGALSNFVFNAPRRHSIFNRPLIDWDLILVMEPSTILGALIGGYINRAFPNWLTTVLLALLLTFISYKLLIRGIVTWHKESLEKRSPSASEGALAQPLLGDSSDIQQQEVRSEVPSGPISIAPVPRQSDSHSPLAYTGSLSKSLSFKRDNLIPPQDGSKAKSGAKNDGSGQPGLSSLEEVEGQENALPAQGANALASLASVEGTSEGPYSRQQSGSVAASALAAAEADGEEGIIVAEEGGAEDKWDKNNDKFAERRQIPPVRFGILVLLTAVVALSDYLKGKVACGTWQYWLLVVAIVPLVLLVTFIARSYLLRKNLLQKEAGYVWREGDVEWNAVTTLTYPAICSLAGLVAGMFGVGGGIVKGPLMLELGVLPDVASATSATMIVFTSASASIVFISFGGIPADYAIAVFLIGLVFTMFGQVTCHALMRVLRRQSVIVFSMAALMLLSMIIIYYEAVASTIAAIRGHRLWRFGRFCG